MKKINVLGLMALLAAGGTALAFNTPEKRADEYSYGQLANGTWVELSPNGRCNESDNKVCIAKFESPTPPAPEATNWISIEHNNGVYMP